MDSRQGYALTVSTPRNFGRVETGTSGHRRGKDMVYFGKVILKVTVFCDLTHKIAVWQGYGLFRFVSCNYQQLKDLT